MRHEGDPGHSQARDGVAFVRLRRRVLRSWEGSATACGVRGLADVRVGRGAVVGGSGWYGWPRTLPEKAPWMTRLRATISSAGLAGARWMESPVMHLGSVTKPLRRDDAHIRTRGQNCLERTEV